MRIGNVTLVFSPLISDEAWARYVDAVAKPSTWGGARQVQAAADAFGVPITWLRVDPVEGFAEERVLPAKGEGGVVGEDKHIASMGRHFWPLVPGCAEGRSEPSSPFKAVGSGNGHMEEAEGEWVESWLAAATFGSPADPTPQVTPAMLALVSDSETD